MNDRTVTTDDLKNKYQNLLLIENKRRKLRDFGATLMFAGMFGPLLFIYLVKDFQSVSSVAIVVMLASMIIGSYIEGKNKKQIFTSHQKAFYEFYSTYESIRKYGDVPNDEKTRKNTITRVNRFADYVDDWIGKNCPQEISDLPKSIYNNIRERIIPLIRENKIKEIQVLMKSIFELIEFVYSNEPTIAKLQTFNNFMESSLPKGKEIERRTHGEVLLVKYPFLKYIWISPLSGVIFGTILYQIDSTKIFESVAYSVTIAVALSGIIIAALRRK